jgi:DNA-binding MarR family transcriptional regulator
VARSGADLALLLLGGFRALADAATEELAVRGYGQIRPVHDFAIRTIDSGADTASELARQLGVSKQAAAKTIAFLEQRDYIRGETDSRDSRRRRYTVTEDGYALLRTGEHVFDELREQWAKRIGDTELQRLEEALSDLGVRIPTSFDAPPYFNNPAE